MNRPEDVVIVLAEDDPGHARLIEKHLSAFVTNRIIRFANGQEAVDYLGREGQVTQQHLLLLDLNMPVMDGYQVLQHLREGPRTAVIPIIVLTTADDPGEIQRCYELGCNAYVVKSADYEQFTEVMRRLGLFLTIAKMPPQEEAAPLAVPDQPAPLPDWPAVPKTAGWPVPKSKIVPDEPPD